MSQYPGPQCKYRMIQKHCFCIKGQVIVEQACSLTVAALKELF